MLADAEKYKEEDDRQRERVASKNQLESYVFSVKQAADDAGGSLSSDEKNRLQKECDDCIKWLDRNQTAEKDEFEHRFKELQKICTPLMTKLHRGGTAGGENAGNRGQQDGPTIEEVD